MKSAVVRFALLSLIVATVAIRVHAVSARDSLVASFDVDLALKSLIESQGFPLKPNPAKPATILSMAVYFQRPDCAEPSVVVPFSLNFEALPFLARIVPSQSYTQTFLYLDGEWPTQSRIRMFIEWLKHAVLEVTGNTRYLPVKTAVVLAEPSSGRGLAPIDWRLIWDKDWNRALVQRRKLDVPERRTARMVSRAPS
jgi:hypothetical protein